MGQENKRKKKNEKRNNRKDLVQTEIGYITYHANQGSQESVTTVSKEGRQVPLLSNMFSFVGHTFVEWNTSPFKRGHVYYPGDVIEVKGEISLYAIWKSEVPILHPFTIKNHILSGEGVPNSQIVVIFPNMYHVDTVVPAHGHFEIEIPPLAKPLEIGEVISVYQTEYNMYKSDAIKVNISA